MISPTREREHRRRVLLQFVRDSGDRVLRLRNGQPLLHVATQCGSPGQSASPQARQGAIVLSPIKRGRHRAQAHSPLGDAASESPALPPLPPAPQEHSAETASMCASPLPSLRSPSASVVEQCHSLPAPAHRAPLSPSELARLSQLLRVSVAEAPKFARYEPPPTPDSVPVVGLTEHTGGKRRGLLARQQRRRRPQRRLNSDDMLDRLLAGAGDAAPPGAGVAAPVTAPSLATTASAHSSSAAAAATATLAAATAPAQGAGAAAGAGTALDSTLDADVLHSILASRNLSRAAFARMFRRQDPEHSEQQRALAGLGSVPDNARLCYGCRVLLQDKATGCFLRVTPEGRADMAPAPVPACALLLFNMHNMQDQGEVRPGDPIWLKVEDHVVAENVLRPLGKHKGYLLGTALLARVADPEMELVRVCLATSPSPWPTPPLLHARRTMPRPALCKWNRGACGSGQRASAPVAPRLRTRPSGKWRARWRTR